MPVRARPAHRSPVVVLIDDRTAPGYQQAYRLLGANNYIRKPVDFERTFSTGWSSMQWVRRLYWLSLNERWQARTRRRNPTRGGGYPTFCSGCRSSYAGAARRFFGAKLGLRRPSSIQARWMPSRMRSPQRFGSSSKSGRPSPVYCGRRNSPASVDVGCVEMGSPELRSTPMSVLSFASALIVYAESRPPARLATTAWQDRRDCGSRPCGLVEYPPPRPRRCSTRKASRTMTWQVAGNGGFLAACLMSMLLFEQRVADGNLPEI